jgi:hypothetical protein
MVTAAHRDNGRNQMKCIEKDKPKNKNKIRQHEKKSIFQYPLSFFLIILLPILPPPLSPSPAMVVENAPSPYPPYINNNSG